MSQVNRLQFTPAEKIAIIVEARKGDVSVSEVCRRHQLSVGLFYEWEWKMKSGSLVRPAPVPKKTRSQLSMEELELENQRLRGIIVEIAQENLQIKKGLWP